MAGILLYTAAPDSEGTLGGLVALGDPSVGVTSTRPSRQCGCARPTRCVRSTTRSKTGSRCTGRPAMRVYSCPKPRAERGNKYLDRSVLVSTVESGDLAFFAKFAEAVPQATITAETDEAVTPPKSVESNLSEIDKLVDLCDERTQEFVRSWATRGLPLPEVGYELRDGSGRGSAPSRTCLAAQRLQPSFPKAAMPGRRSSDAAGQSLMPWTLASTKSNCGRCWRAESHG